MNVLITGVAGFLGSHLAEHHLKAGDTVWGIDNFSTALGPDAPHFLQLKRHPAFHFFEEDVTDFTEVFGWTQFGQTAGCKIDLVYNFACPASPPRYQAMPVETMMTSVVGTRNMLEVARQQKAIFVQASTSEVYGDPNVSPQPESYVGNVNSYGPRSCYDEGKRAAEALCFDYLKKHGVDARLVRIFNTYGPHMDPDDGRVVTNFIKQALKGEKLTVYGDGKQTRSFTYVSDLIGGITKLAALKENPGTPINVGNPTEFTMLELAHAVLDEVKVGSDWHFDKNFTPNDAVIQRLPLPKDDPTQRCPNITLAREILKWEPKVSLRDGLKLMVPYMREMLAQPKFGHLSL